MKGLKSKEKTYLEGVNYWSGSYDAPHNAIVMSSDQEEMADEMVRRGLIVFLRCGHEDCNFLHPHITATGKDALKIAELLKTNWGVE